MKINLTSDIGYFFIFTFKALIIGFSGFSLYSLYFGSYFDPVYIVLLLTIYFYKKYVYNSKEIYFDDKFLYYDNKVIDIKKIRKFGENFLEIEEQENIIKKVKFIHFFSNSLQTLIFFFNKK